MTTIDGSTLKGVSATTQLLFWPPLDRIGLYRRNRPSITLLEFGR